MISKSHQLAEVLNPYNTYYLKYIVLMLLNIIYKYISI